LVSFSFLIFGKYVITFMAEGVWKCHHCTWSTKRFDSPRTGPMWNLKGYPDLLMNVKTLIQHGPCFVWETKGQ